MRAVILLVALIIGAGRCTVDRSNDGWPGQRDAFAKLCRWGVCFFAALLLFATPARADTPISKCWASICAEPQVSTTTLVYRFDADSLAIALPAGAVGYGVRLPSGYASAGLFLDAAVGTGGAQSYLGIAVLATVMRAVSLGVVFHLVGDPWIGLALGWSATSALGLEADKPAERWE